MIAAHCWSLSAKSAPHQRAAARPGVVDASTRGHDSTVPAPWPGRARTNAQRVAVVARPRPTNVLGADGAARPASAGARRACAPSSSGCGGCGCTLGSVVAALRSWTSSAPPGSPGGPASVVDGAVVDGELVEAELGCSATSAVGRVLAGLEVDDARPGRRRRPRAGRRSRAGARPARRRAASPRRRAAPRWRATVRAPAVRARRGSAQRAATASRSRSPRPRGAEVQPVPDLVDVRHQRRRRSGRQLAAWRPGRRGRGRRCRSPGAGAHALRRRPRARGTTGPGRSSSARARSPRARPARRAARSGSVGAGRRAGAPPGRRVGRRATGRPRTVGSPASRASRRRGGRAQRLGLCRGRRRCGAARRPARRATAAAAAGPDLVLGIVDAELVRGTATAARRRRRARPPR